MSASADMGARVSPQTFARQQYEALAQQASMGWLEGVRAEGFKVLSGLRFPSSRDEAWKYTDVGGVVGNAPTHTPAPHLAQTDREQIRSFCSRVQAPITLVFVDGHHQPDLSTGVPAASRATEAEVGGSAAAAAAGATATEASGAHAAAGAVSPLSALIGERQEAVHRLLGNAVPADHSFVGLNTTLVIDGPVVWVPKNVRIPDLIHIVHVATGRAGSAIFPRAFFRLDAGSEATVCESFVCLSSNGGTDSDSYVCSPVAEISVGAGAALRHLRLQEDGAAAAHVAVVGAQVERDATYEQMQLCIGGQRVRQEIHVRLQGAGARCALRGLSLAGGNQRVDNHLSVEHAEPHCTSEQTYKGVVAGRAAGTFTGRVAVARHAQKAEAHQLNRTLVLSKSASANARPILEILADDVKCSHGATVGQLDDRALFYLQSRGIDADAAKRMLTQAFCADILTSVAAPSVRAVFEERIERWLAADPQTPAAGRGGSER